jgi:hypothetical protein
MATPGKIRSARHRQLQKCRREEQAKRRLRQRAEKKNKEEKQRKGKGDGGKHKVCIVSLDFVIISQMRCAI